jgi:hypothetical protein
MSRGGADGVLELPVCLAAAFGSEFESGDIDMTRTVARLLAESVEANGCVMPLMEPRRPFPCILP